mgnify:CR=1 FL=1
MQSLQPAKTLGPGRGQRNGTEHIGVLFSAKGPRTSAEGLCRFAPAHRPQRGAVRGATPLQRGSLSGARPPATERHSDCVRMHPHTRMMQYIGGRTPPPGYVQGFR